MPSSLTLPAAASESEPSFSLAEMFFSITDKKGIIRSGNEVFVRVSGYPIDRMVGRPHNIVRHPDMPRIVFKLLWDEIGAGRPIAAYVKNRTADGRAYWVIAVVVPIPDGHLSIRIKPSSPVFAVAQALYKRLRKLEVQVEGPQGLRRKEALAASAELLQQELAALGYENYEAFMRAAILAEVRAREEAAARSTVKLTGDNQAGDVARRLSDANLLLAQLVLRLDEYLALNARLAEKAGFVRAVADEVRLFALNAILSASKVDGRDGAAIGAVAGLLSTHSESLGRLFNDLGDSIGAATRSLGEMLFPVASARIQAEMLQHFWDELRSSHAAEHDDLHAMHASITSAGAALAGLLWQFNTALDQLSSNVSHLRRGLQTMRALALNGRIEAARVESDGPFTQLFLTIAQRVDAAGAELDELAAAAAVFAQYNDSASKIENAIETVGRALGRLEQSPAAA